VAFLVSSLLRVIGVAHHALDMPPQVSPQFGIDVVNPDFPR
jgi:hypothetical protein